MELLNFPMAGGKVNLAEKIGVDYYKFGVLLLEDRDGDKISALEKELGDLVKGVQISVAIGDPAREVTEAASRDGADLIVMPTHSRAALDRLLYGSVAERVVRTATCPILTVPPALR